MGLIYIPNLKFNLFELLLQMKFSSEGLIIITCVGHQQSILRCWLKVQELLREK